MTEDESYLQAQRWIAKAEGRDPLSLFIKDLISLALLGITIYLAVVAAIFTTQ